jgi:hypothetical protein
MRRTMSRFADPAQRKQTTRERSSAGIVSVTRSRTGNAGGAIARDTHRSRASSAGSPGKSEAVCPSSPTPRRATSRIGSAGSKAAGWKIARIVRS